MSAWPWWQAGQRLAILSALVDEQRGLIDHLEQPERIEHAGRIFWLGRLHGLPVVLTVSRIGKVSETVFSFRLGMLAGGGGGGVPSRLPKSQWPRMTGDVRVA